MLVILDGGLNASERAAYPSKLRALNWWRMESIWLAGGVPNHLKFGEKEGEG